ncbi:MAG: hypothetical protein SCH66_01270 [Methanolobus sp.]|nr:hypothetical protein [Methanolobus sp.]
MCHNNVLELSDEKRFGIDVIARIPCMCDVATRSNEILSLTDQDHVFSKAIFNMKDMVERLYL